MAFEQVQIPSFLKSNYFYIGIAIGCCSLFYLRRQIQGYYFDRKAIVSRNDLTGKTAIITGGNAGIGLGTAIHLSRLNANIIIATRNEQRANTAVEYIKQQSGNKNVRFMQLDLSKLKSVKSFASEINESSEFEIDFLVLNAGILSSSTLSEDGYGTLFQTNYFGHWYLTNLLLDRMKNTANKRWKADGNKYGAPVRIISVSSGGHSSAHIPFDGDNEWNAFIGGECGYGQSKLLQIVHMKQLQTELNENGFEEKIQCVSITPGMVRTNIFSKNLALQSLFVGLYPLFWYLSRDKMSGAQTVLHAATNDAIVSGGYYSNCLLKPTKGKNGSSNDQNVWKAVWNRTNELVTKIQ